MEKVLKNNLTKVSIVLLLGALLVAILSGCASTSVCDNCGKSFTGNGYFDVLRSYDYTLCQECAEDYYSPLPYEPYEKK